MNKHDEDLHKGMQHRKIVENYVNNIAMALDSSIRLERQHCYLRQMSIQEKREGNTKTNREETNRGRWAMGLNYVITKIGHEVSVPLFIRFTNDWNLFYKLPSDVMKTPGDIKYFVKAMCFKYLVLFFDRPKNEKVRKYAGPYPMRTYWEQGWSRSKIKGNRNRIDFDYNNKQLQTASILKGGGLKGSELEILPLIESLEKVYYENLSGNMVT